jgi:hypothetical protein
VIDLGCGDGYAMMGFPTSFTPFGMEISAKLSASAHSAFAPRGGSALNAACVDGLRRYPKA